MENTTIDKIKNFIGNNGNSKGYKFYRIGGEVEDSGIIYCLDTALKSYLNHHHEGNFKILNSGQKHGDCYSSTIAVKGPLNIEEFKHNIDSSGRQATKENLKTKIKVDSINMDKLLMEEIKNDYEEKLRNKEYEIGNFKAQLDDTAKSLEERIKKISSLELEIKNRPKVKFNSVLEALLEGYIGNNEELIFDFVEDYKKLKQNGDIEVFLKKSSEREEFSYLAYLNSKYNLNISSEEELSLSLQKKEEEKDWSMTQKGKELKELERRHKNGYSLLELVKVAGFTSEMIASVRSVVEKNGLAEVQKSIEEYNVQFENEKRIYGEIRDSKDKYKEFKEISEKAIRRKSEKLPILIHPQQEQWKVYAPLALGDEETQKEICEILSYNLKDKSISLIPRVYSETVGEFSLSINPPLENTRLNDLAKKISQLFRENDIINSLCGGARPDIKIN